MELAGARWARLLSATHCDLSALQWPSEWSSWYHREELLRRGSDGLTLTYGRRGRQNAPRALKGPASAQSDLPIPAGVPFYYFEVEILNAPDEDEEQAGDDSMECFRIGFGEKHSPATAMPGDSFDSVGYGSDGVVVHSGHNATVEGQQHARLKFRRGDTLGCGLTSSTRQLLLTHNGVMLGGGAAVSGALAQSPLYPKVGLEWDGAKLVANFGQRPFKFDVASYLRSNPAIIRVKLPPIAPPPISTPQLTSTQRLCRDEQWEALYPAGVAFHSRLPACWNRDDRRRSLAVAADCLTLSLTANSTHDDDASHDSPATVRADCPIPEEGCRLHYFEVLITATGCNDSAGAMIGVGYAVESAHLGEMLGWRGDSIGIHTHDCRVYSNSLFGSKLDDFTKRPFTVGDVVGCGVDFGKQECFFTLNGKYLGRLCDVRRCAEMRQQTLFPAVSMASPGAEAVANFGQQRFEFPIGEYIEKVCNPHISKREMIEFRHRIEAQPPPGFIPPAKSAKKRDKDAAEALNAAPSPAGCRATRASRNMLQSSSGPGKEPGSTPQRGKKRTSERDPSDQTPGDDGVGDAPTLLPAGRGEDVAGPSNANGTLSLRQRIYAMQHIVPAILSGRLTDTLRMIGAELSENFLPRHQELHFQLKLREFVETVAADGSPSAGPSPSVQPDEGDGDSSASSGSSEVVCLWSSPRKTESEMSCHTEKPSSSCTNKFADKPDGASKEAAVRRIGREITSLFTQLDPTRPDHSELNMLMNSVLALPNWETDSAFSRELFDEKHRFSLAKRFQAVVDE